MKAFLLAAGLGTRLRPITDTIPKCMVAIDGQPLLDIWLDAFDRAGVDEVLVNLHHLPEIVGHHVADRTGPPSVRLVFEPELLGKIDDRTFQRETGQVRPLRSSQNRDQAAETRSHQAYVPIPAIFHEIDRSLCLFNRQTDGDLIERALAFPMSEEVEAKGGDALVDQRSGQRSIRRAGFR